MNSDPSDQPRFDPNSVHAMIATMMERQNQMHTENVAAADERKAQLNRIEEQVRKTNGRVTKLEGWREDQAAAIKTAAKVGSITVLIVGFLFGGQLKERVLLDPAAVRRLADEQVAAASGANFSRLPPAP